MLGMFCQVLLLSRFRPDQFLAKKGFLITVHFSAVLSFTRKLPPLSVVILTVLHFVILVLLWAVTWQLIACGKGRKGL